MQWKMPYRRQRRGGRVKIWRIHRITYRCTRTCTRDKHNCQFHVLHRDTPQIQLLPSTIDQCGRPKHCPLIHADRNMRALPLYQTPGSFGSQFSVESRQGESKTVSRDTKVIYTVQRFSITIEKKTAFIFPD